MRFTTLAITTALAVGPCGMVYAQVAPPSSPGLLVASRLLALDEAWRLAESAHPALKAKQAQLQAVQGALADARSPFYNNPQASVDLTRRQVPRAGSGDARQQEWGAGLSQTLETGGQATAVKSITGRGVEAQVDGELVLIGKPVLFSEIPGSGLPAAVAAANKDLVAAGRTTMVVRKGQRFLGILAVMDTPRPVAPQVMAELRALGIERLIMISGDNQQVAEAVAKSVGLTEARGDLMPEQKVEAIKALREAYGKVAMVGDGVNDAPAMANATVGIAMGAAGSDVALETADVALMADDLAQLPFAVGLSRSTSRIIKQNLYVNLGVVAVLISPTSRLAVAPKA